MIEDVEEAGESIVVGEEVMIGLLGGRERQGALRPEHSHILDEDLERLGLVVGLLHTGKV